MVIKILFVACLMGWLSATELSASEGLSYADNQIFSHGYVDFDQAGPLVMPDYPFASPGRTLVFQSSYRSLYNMKELTDNRGAISLSNDRWSGGVAVASFGEPDYFHQMGLSMFASWRKKSFSVGGSLIYSRMSFNEKYDALSLITANLGTAWRCHNVTVFALTRSLNQPRYYDRGPAIAPEAEIGLSYKSREGLESQAKALFIRHQKPTAELSQAFRLNEYASLNWALVLLPARFGGGLHLEKGPLGFDYKLSHHPVLGLTHTVMLSIFKIRHEENTAK